MSVAVIVVNYNYSAFLLDCLASIADTDIDDVRVIIVDDASTDNSVEVARQWASGSRLSVDIVVNARNGGPASAYNRAREHLRDTDEFVCFIDADDVFEHQRFTDQLVAMRERHNLAVVYSDVRLFGNGVEGGTRPARCPDAGETVTERLLRDSSLCALNSALIRKSSLDRTPRLDEALRVCDYPMWLSLSRTGGFEYLPGVVAAVRIHGSSMSRSELLTSDRLTILGRHARSRSERAAARIRGRRLMNAALISGTKPRLGAFVVYGRGTRDWRAAAFLLATRLPGATRLANTLRSHEQDVSP